LQRHHDPAHCWDDRHSYLLDHWHELRVVLVRLYEEGCEMTLLWLKVLELMIAIAIGVFCQFVVAPMATRAADFVDRLVGRFKGC
jgi:hypothetical protein